MKRSLKLALAGMLGVGALTLAAGNASAAIVCNGAGYCWHTHHHYHYHPGFGVVVHPNNWHWGPHEHFAWHEHRGRGYWRDGAWVRF
jgi:hypothetical protein